MPDTQRTSSSTVRRTVKSFIGMHPSDYLTNFPVRYAIAYGTDENYLFFWLRVSDDKRYFESAYKHLSRQDGSFRDSENSQFFAIPNRIPHDITDEELDRVVEDRLAKFDSKGGDIIRVDSRRTLSV